MGRSLSAVVYYGFDPTDGDTPLNEVALDRLGTALDMDDDDLRDSLYEAGLKEVLELTGLDISELQFPYIGWEEYAFAHVAAVVAVDDYCDLLKLPRPTLEARRQLQDVAEMLGCKDTIGWYVGGRFW